MPLGSTLAAPPVWSGTQARVMVDAGNSYEVREVDPQTGATQKLAAVNEPYGYVQLAGSPYLTAVRGTGLGCPREGQGCKYDDYEFEADDLLAAAPGASLRCVFSLQITGCARQAPCWIATPVLVSGYRMAYQICSKENEVGTVVVDTSPSGSVPLRITQIGLPLSLAGQWLVGLAPGLQGAGETTSAPVLVEINLTTGAEARTDLPPVRKEAPTPGFSGRYPALASVQEDGEVV
jgi:hypothetical protein